jgi:hypothetical protein
MNPIEPCRMLFTDIQFCFLRNLKCALQQKYYGILKLYQY